MKTNTTVKSLIFAGITFVVFFAGTMIVMNKCQSSKDDIVLVGDTVTSEGKVMEFDYQNHKFINIVKVDDNGKQESFVVHDPNCRCMTKKLNNITTVITNTDNHNTASSDSIMRANFRVIISKLNGLSTENQNLTREVKTLRTEVAMLKKSRPNPVWKAPVSTKKKVNTKKR